MIIRLITLLICFSLLVNLLSCKDEINPSSNKPPEINSVTPSVFRYDIPGKGVQKIVCNKSGYYLVVQEELSALKRFPGIRSISVLTAKGELAASIEPLNESENIIDATADDENIFVASIHSISDTKEHVLIKKMGLHGQLINQVSFEEEEETNGLARVLSDDRVSIASGSDAVYVAVYKNDCTIFVHALGKDQLNVLWSLQVEPRTPRMAWAMTGGSYDTFGQMVASYKVYLDVDNNNNICVAIPVIDNFTIKRHNTFFGENLGTIGGDAALVTKVSANGKRIFSIVMGTEHGDEMKSLRCFDGKIVVAGRTDVAYSNDWHAYLSVHDSETGSEIFTKTYKSGENAIFFGVGFDVLSGSFYAGGNSGWSQNPYGVSISDNGKKLLTRINVSSANEQIMLSNKAGQNQISSVQILDNFIVIGGWENGPGTHTGDNDESLVRADGFVEVFPIEK
jgi:hypothetical protein